MASVRLRRIAAGVGLGAAIAMMGFTAGCSTDSETPEESSTTTTTTTTTTTPPLSPTEKAPKPDGPDIFTPPVKAPQPTVNQNDRYGPGQ